MAIEQEIPSKEIIDATQNAVLDAAGNVASMIENTAGEISGHGEVFYQSPEFWVAVSFVLVVVFLARPISRIFKKMMIKRIYAIANRIQEASDLKDDAQKLLVEYEKKFIRAKEEAENILEKSEREINLIKKESLNRLERDMATKEKEAHMRIETAQVEASKEIARLTSELTIKAVKTAIADNLNEQSQDKLIEQSIGLIGKLKLD